MFVRIALPLPIDKYFTYSLPDDSCQSEVIGRRALVPFGKRQLTGIIIDIQAEVGPDEKIRPVSELLDDEPLFTKDMLGITRWIADYYICSHGEALKAALPAGMAPKTVLRINLNREITEEELTSMQKSAPKRAALLKLILGHKDNITVDFLQNELKAQSVSDQLDALVQMNMITITSGLTKQSEHKTQKALRIPDSIYESESAMKDMLDELDKKNQRHSTLISYVYLNQMNNRTSLVTETLKELNLSVSMVSTLTKKGYLEVNDERVDRNLPGETTLAVRDESILELTNEQSHCVEQILSSFENGDSKPFLIHGVTGSGKTLVYMHIIRHIINSGKTVLMLVPEISLTPQMIDRFRIVFGDSVTALHSRMSDGERYDAWRRIHSDETQIVIGARSAIFSPLNNLGLIIVDEEHEGSYKQDEPSPRYNARDVAIVRGKTENALVILGSATPSIESRYNAETGRYRLLEIRSRADGAELPQIVLVDKTTSQKSGQMSGNFSKQMINAIIERLERKEGTIIFHNRRGFASYMECPDCAYVPMCKNCDVSMTQHKSKNQLRCHYCGYTINIHKACPACGHPELKEVGSGTQRVEDELMDILRSESYSPVVQRVDLDTTSKRGSLRRILSAFAEGSIDILVGTQMVAKGLDFERVTLVGVVNADVQLFLPDFRATERTYQLLTQVSGRAGRTASKPGEVYIQTSHPRSVALEAVMVGSYHPFYKAELDTRRESLYPPFVRFICIEISGKDMKKVNYHAKTFSRMIKTHSSFVIIGPSQPLIPRLRNLWREVIIIKSIKSKDPSGKIFRKALADARAEYSAKHSTSAIRLKIDVDAYNSV
jgi:primosomal protein N' (replication factor Y)